MVSYNVKKYGVENIPLKNEWLAMSQMIRLVCVGVNLDTVWQQRGPLSLIMPSTGHIFPYEFAMHLKQKQPCKYFFA